MNKDMPSFDIFKGAIRKIRNAIFRKTAKTMPDIGNVSANTRTIDTGSNVSYTDNLRSGFPSNIRPSDEIVRARFTTFSSSAIYNPKSNRYLDGNTKRFISRDEFLNRLSNHRKNVAFEQSKLTKPNLTDRERRELLDKFISASERLKQGREEDIKQDLIDGLYDEYQSAKDELGIVSP